MTIEEFKDMVATTDTTYEYNGKTFLACGTDKGYEFLSNEERTYYDTIDDLVNNQMFDGKPLKDCLPQVDW